MKKPFGKISIYNFYINDCEINDIIIRKYNFVIKKSKFWDETHHFIGVIIAPNIFQNYKCIINDLENMHDSPQYVYPTKQRTPNGLQKMFFRHRYFWKSKNIDGDNRKYCSGFRGDTQIEPAFVQNICTKLKNMNLINFEANIFASNKYDNNYPNPGINAHIDRGFVSDICSYSVMHHSRLNFKPFEQG